MGRSKRKVYRMKLATRSVILALGVAGILSTGLPAHATAPALAVVSTPNTSDLDSVYDWYIEQGVDDATANTLVAKLRSGVLTDANTGATPTSVATDTSDGWQTTRSTYADGSISISKLQVASEAAPVADGVAPFSVGGDCSQVVGGSGYAKYYACGVYESTDLLAMSFRADYTLTNAGIGAINDAYSPYANARGGTADTPPSLAITKSQSNSSGPAIARAVTQFSGSAGSFTAYLYLNVAGSAWSSKSWS